MHLVDKHQSAPEIVTPLFWITYIEVMLQLGSWIGPPSYIIVEPRKNPEKSLVGLLETLKCLKKKGTSPRQAAIYWCPTTWLPSDLLLRSILSWGRPPRRQRRIKGKSAKKLKMGGFTQGEGKKKKRPFLTKALRGRKFAQTKGKSQIWTVISVTYSLSSIYMLLRECVLLQLDILLFCIASQNLLIFWVVYKMAFSPRANKDEAQSSDQSMRSKDWRLTPCLK